jgi:hypothetical protein
MEDVPATPDGIAVNSRKRSCNAALPVHNLTGNTTAMNRGFYNTDWRNGGGRKKK